jgi:hypothetical protein
MMVRGDVLAVPGRPYLYGVHPVLNAGVMRNVGRGCKRDFSVRHPISQEGSRERSAGKNGVCHPALHDNWPSAGLSAGDYLLARPPRSPPTNGQKET